MKHSSDSKDMTSSFWRSNKCYRHNLCVDIKSQPCWNTVCVWNVCWKALDNFLLLKWMLKSEPGGNFFPTHCSYLSLKWNINPNCGSSIKGMHCLNTIYVLNVCWDLKSEVLSPQWIPKRDNFFFMYLEYCHWTSYEYIVRENHIASLSLKPNTYGTEIIAFQSGSGRRLQKLCSKNQINHALILLLCRVGIGLVKSV